MIGRSQVLGIVIATTTAFAVSSAVVVLSRDRGQEPGPAAAQVSTDQGPTTVSNSTGPQPAATTTSSASVTATPTAGTDPTKVPPDDALSPDQIAALPTPTGTVVSPVESPVTWGRFRILPVGSVPGWPPDLSDAYAPGRTQVRVDMEQGTGEAECSGFRLYVPALNLPPGFRLEGCTQQTIVWDDGSTLTFNYFAGYWVEGRFPFIVSRSLVPPGAQWEVVDETPPVVVSLTTVGSTEVVLRHQQAGAAFQGPFTTFFFSDDVLTEIEAAGVDARDLLAVAEAMIQAVAAAGN